MEPVLVNFAFSCLDGSRTALLVSDPCLDDGSAAEVFMLVPR